MKAKKVYEFINPKTDKYELEDTVPLGPKALKIAEIEDWFETWAPDMNFKIDDDLNILAKKQYGPGKNSTIDLRNTDANWIPNNLNLHGILEISNCKITKLPENLNVYWLTIKNQDIYELPDNLTIEVDLEINNTKITKLPNKLRVKRDLYIFNSDISELPNDLYVGENIYIDNTKIDILNVGYEQRRKIIEYYL